MRHRYEAETGYARRCLLAIVGAMLLALAAAVPVFAAEETTPEEPVSGESTTGEDGGTVQPQVVGGTAVPNGKYPFMVALLDATRQGTDYQKQFCGGTLIDADSVLTAAHCLEGTLSAEVQVVVGRTVLDSDQGQKRNVIAITRHPRYTTAEISFRYDAAVLQLSSPVSGIKPVRLPGTSKNAFEKPGRKLTIAGWGNTTKQSPSGYEPDSFPNRMQEAEVPVVSDRGAKRIYGSSYAKGLMVAAGRENKDSCQGDSGGPLFERTDRGRYQVGITSFGAGCGARGFPGVYAEVNSGEIRPFIANAAG